MRQAELAPTTRIRIEPPLQPNSQRAFSVSFERLLPDFYAGEENDAVVDLFTDDRIADLAIYSPIVVYGPNGSGKTALVHSLQCRWERSHQLKKAFQISGSDFSRYLAGAIASDDMTHFRERTRQASSLFIDSLEGIANKFTAQDELVSVIDELSENQCPIFVTSVELPQSIRGLKKSFASRLSGGTSVQLSFPSHTAISLAINDLAGELSRHRPNEALLQTFLNRLPKEVSLHSVRGMLLDYIKNSFKPDNVVERVTSATHEQDDQASDWVSKEDSKLIEKIIRSRDPSLNIKAPQIIRAVAKHSGCALTELKGPTRKSQIVRARSLAMYLCRTLAHMPLEKIGQHFGNRDHTTVIHAVRKIETQIESDPLLIRLKNDTLRELRQTTS